MTIETDSKAVIAYDVEFACMLARGRTFHQSYHQLTSAGVRPAATFTDDCLRGVVDRALFGSVSDRISMAALSPDSRGLTSYGSVFFELRDAVCRPRASLLIENSFPFAKRYGYDPLAIPEGFRAVWDDRAKLAVTKLAPQLTPATTLEDLRAMILSSTGDRSTDEFIEVHVWGGMDIQAFARVRGPADLTDPVAATYLRELRDRLRSHNITWEDIP